MCEAVPKSIPRLSNWRKYPSMGTAFPLSMITPDQSSVIEQVINNLKIWHYEFMKQFYQ